MEENVEKVVNCHFSIKQSEEQLNEDLLDHLAVVRNAVDSPSLLLIMRNAILTLLETPNQSFNWKAIHALLTDDEFRGRVVNKLKQATPTFWIEGWDELCKIDENPVSSKAQPRIVKRHSLIVYWTEEWKAIPKNERNRAAQIIESL